jgi:hypothetical protein
MLPDHAEGQPVGLRPSGQQPHERSRPGGRAGPRATTSPRLVGFVGGPIEGPDIEDRARIDAVRIQQEGDTLER